MSSDSYFSAPSNLVFLMFLLLDKNKKKDLVS